MRQNAFFNSSFQDKVSLSPREKHTNVSCEENSIQTHHSASFTVNGTLKSIADSVGWEIKFETKDCYYFKSNLTSKLDEGFGDIAGQIADIEHEILLQIENEVFIT